MHATIPKGNMGYNQYTVPDTVAVELTFIWRKIISVIYATYAGAKRKPEKKIRLVRDSNP